MPKNGVPVGYGGGWPFLATCRTGTNVFAPFRGGESSWLFAQVLRAYRQHFGVKRFVVEPYQFGAGNREGLLSGAFWFYTGWASDRWNLTRHSLRARRSGACGAKDTDRR